MSSTKFKTDVRIDANLNLNNDVANRALITDGSKNVVASPVTSTELGHLSGVTSAIQTQLDAKIDNSEKGAPDGVATLDSGGKIPVSQLPNSIMEFQGQWDASTNSPTLADGVGNAGDVYRINVAGTQDLGSGSVAYEVGDWIMYSGTVWQKADNTDAVTSVNGQTGIVVLDTDDIAEGTNLYFTDERAQDAVGTILVDSASVDLTYNDGTPSITAAVIPGGVDHDQLLNFSVNEHIDHSSVEIATAADSGLAGGGDITTTRNLSVDINGTTAETSADNADKILIYDDSAAALKSMTRGNFLSGIPQASAGDINETAFTSVANNQTTPANVTGLVFSGSVASFEAQVYVTIVTTGDSINEMFTLKGVQTSTDWEMAVTAVGDDSLVNFSINAGQVQYTSADTPDFVEGAIKFRAETLDVNY